jgi:alpha-D-xyloside xylohydrolase
MPSSRVLSHAVEPGRLLIRLEHGLLALEPRSPRTIRIRYTLEPQLSGKPSLMVLPLAEDPPRVPFEVRETATELVLTTGLLSVEIDLASGRLTYRDAGGVLLTREPAGAGRTLERIDVLRSVFDDAIVVENHDNVDGVRIAALGVRQVVDRVAYHTKLEFEWQHGEALYGLGSHEEGMFNLRGQHQYLYQENLKVSVPVLLSTRGYGVFMDCTSLVTFHDDAFGSYLWGDVDEELDYYVMVGPEFDQIIAELRTLTGRAPMLPRWAFGYIQSKERYENQGELVDIAREYRRRQLPLDCVVLDWKSWTGDLWGQKSLDPDRFPDPGRLTRELHALGVRLMVSIWPIMREGGDDWRELEARGQLLGNRATYNAFDPAARQTFWQQAERGLFTHGVDAWWSDCTEPFEADWSGEVKPEPEERMRINTEEAKRYLDPELINAYALAHAEGIYAGQRAAGDEKRVVNMTRSALAGQQRFGNVSWSGDVTATWETLRRQIADALNFSVTGLPYWTTDIGGFFAGRRPNLWFWAGDFDEGVADAGYRELYLRWFQFAAWLPIFRAHGTDTPREVWRFGDPGEPVYDALADALRLRYLLLPYVYSLGAWTTHRNYTLLRGLPFDFRSDPRTYEVADEFMFGPAFLVCPVTLPMFHGPGSRSIDDQPRTRPVYLPAGNQWFNFWTDELLDGGQTLEADAPLKQIPLFVRAGSIIPMGPARQHADEAPDARLELHIYPGRDTSFSLYEDEGDSYRYESGAFAMIEFSWHEAERRLTIGQRVGEYPGMSAEREIVAILHAERGAAAESGRVMPSTQVVCFTGQAVVVQW